MLNLKIMRMAMFKNQTQVAALINHSLPTYNKIENGIIEPSEETKKKLEAIFSRPASFLLSSTGIDELMKKEA